MANKPEKREKNDQPQPMSRRTLLLSGTGGALALGLSPDGSRRRRQSPRIAVIGAGAFGGWTALHLLRAGARVTLVDAWGAGNSRASSGGETRIIRAGYGPDRVYVEMVARALELWRENEKRWGLQLFHETGALWMLGDDDDYVTASVPFMRDVGLAFEELAADEASRRFPQIHFEGVRWAFVERRAGYLLARRACHTVCESFVEEGGRFQRAAVGEPISMGGARSLERLRLSNGARLEADAYVFACGPWLGRLFPDVVGRLIRPTRQEVFYFGVPPGDRRFTDASLPPWIAPPWRERGERFFYGIAGNERRGFKIADDTRGAEFDPTDGDRTPSPESIELARDYLGFRFPALAGAPLLEARVCQYEQSPDGHFIVDRHPRVENVWLVGGGSGHGFKHGPALGERVAQIVLGEGAVEPFFALSRFDGGA